LWQMAREEYLGPLIDIVENKRKYSDIAKKCLEVLDLECLNESESESILSREESLRIRNAFRVWDGRLNSNQKNTLNYLRMKLERGKPHSKIISEHGSIPVSNSPSDSAHGGKNMAHQIEKLYAETKRRNQPK